MLCIIECVFIFTLLFVVGHNMPYYEQNDNINELRRMIDNKELYDNLIELERLIIQSLELDKLKLPLLKPYMNANLNLSNFKKIKIYLGYNKVYSYVVPTSKANIEDLVQYEYITKKQLIESYKYENSDLIKKKSLVVRTLKIIKYMLLPMLFYKQTKDLKKSLIYLNSFFYSNLKSRKSDKLFFRMNPIVWLFRTTGLNYRKTRRNVFLHNILENVNVDMINSNDIYFNSNANINFMESLDKLSKYYGLGIFSSIGSHFIALGHFIILKLAFKLFYNYFQIGNLKFFSWQKILQFNISDRFKALDLICNEVSNYTENVKRREQYLKNVRKMTIRECNILEFLIHYFNRYQIELYTNVYQTNLKVQILLEHTHLKEEFFKYMCNNEKNCNIYDSDNFKSEIIVVVKKKDKNEFSKNAYPKSYIDIDAFNIYINFMYFIKYYSYLSYKGISYIHLLNLIGILNNQSKAYVSSLYLPGYYNAIQLSFDEKSNLLELYGNLLNCVEICHSGSIRYKSILFNVNFLPYERSKIDICNICKGTFIYINSSDGGKLSMIQKFYTYVTKVAKVNDINILIKNMSIYENYDNFLSHDVNWFTFLLLFRFSTYKNIFHNNIAKAMYLSLKKEDKFKRTITTSYWFPSPIKKYYSLYVRKHASTSLLKKLESLLNNEFIEKIKKCITFIIHLHSFLQLDFFYYLIERNMNEYVFPLTMLIESKFREWMKSFELNRFFLEYEKEDIGDDTINRRNVGRYMTPRYRKWILIIKKIIDRSYEMYFNQKNVKNLYKYHNMYGINNKIMLMKDSYELYSMNFHDVIFYADILNIKDKDLSFTTKSKLKMARYSFYLHSIMGNDANFYRYGMIYGFIINKGYLKEVVNTLFSIYKMNSNVFSDTSFLQTVYLLFKKIEKSFYSHRRNDDINRNNNFFFNVNYNYSKMSKEERQKEINNSMASKFFAKSLFVPFQMMFSMKLSRYMDDLDRKFGSEEFLGLMINENSFMNYSYISHGSILDILTNSFLPYYAKKPISQLKYGKAFILSNFHKLCSYIFSALNLNNLSLLLEYQAIASSNFYVTKKLNQFMDKKIELVCLVFLVQMTPGYLEFLGKLSSYIESKEWKMVYDITSLVAFPNVLLPISYTSLYEIGNIYLRRKIFSASNPPNKLQEEIKKKSLHAPLYVKKKVHTITFNYFLKYLHATLFCWLLYHFFGWYYYFDFSILILRNRIRVFDRYYSIFENSVGNLLQKFNIFTIDPILSVARKAQIYMHRREQYEDIVKSRINIKGIYKQLNIKNLEEQIHILTPQEVEKLSEYENLIYVDDNSFFEGLDENEEFLNKRKTICYEEKSKSKNIGKSIHTKEVTKVEGKQSEVTILKNTEKELKYYSDEESAYPELYCTDV